MGDERDNAAFKYQTAAQLGEIKEAINGIREDVKDHGLKIVNIESALWGYPRGDGIGLLEKHRKLTKNWTIAISVCVFIFSALGRIISPLYDKWVADWAYNSPSEKWLRESRRPKVTVLKIIRKREPEPTEETNGR